MMRRARWSLLFMATVGWLTISEGARAQEAPFGRPFDIAINSTSSSLAGFVGVESALLTPFAVFDYRSIPSNKDENATRTIEVNEKRFLMLFNPGADVFVIEHLSVGGELLFSKNWGSRETVTTPKPAGPITTVKDDGPDSTTFGLLPRVGYNVRLHRYFSCWPRGGFGYVTSTTTVHAMPTDIETSRKAFVLYADVPFLWHPSRSFFVGVGPGFTQSLSHSTTQGGVSTSQPSFTAIRFLGFTIGGVVN